MLHVPRMYCRHCGSWDGRWAVTDGAATLHSWTVVAHQVHPAYPVPYTLLLVDLDAAPGTHLVGRVDGAPDLAAGMPLEIWFEELGETDGRPVVVPNWRPVPPADRSHRHDIDWRRGRATIDHDVSPPSRWSLRPTF